MGRVQLPLGELGGDRVAVLLGAAGVRLRQDDPDLGLALADEGDPPEASLGDLDFTVRPRVSR